MRLEQADPKGLIRESYRMEGLDESECRSIFLDWTLSLPVAVDTQRALKRLLAEYGGDAPDHPMTGILRAGREAGPPPKRRGGAAARRT